MRNRESLWAALSAAERAAFKAKVEARAALTQVFSNYGAPDMEQIKRAEAAEERWNAAKAACDRFVAEYRKSA